MVQLLLIGVAFTAMGALEFGEGHRTHEADNRHYVNLRAGDPSQDRLPLERIRLDSEVTEAQR
jgi:hypothetical protein